MNGTPTKVLLFGAGSQLGRYLAHDLRRSGCDVREFSASRGPRYDEAAIARVNAELRQGDRLTVVWLHGLTRPSDKNVNLAHQFDLAIVPLRAFIRDVAHHTDQIAFHFTGSLLQLAVRDPTLFDEYSYCLAKDFSARLVRDNFARHKIWLLGNNEGLLRPYGHWLQDLLWNLKHHLDHHPDRIVPVTVFGGRQIRLNATAEIARLMSDDIVTGRFDAGQVLASRLAPTDVAALVQEFCNFARCDEQTLGITFQPAPKLHEPDLDLSHVTHERYFSGLGPFSLADLQQLFAAYDSVIATK